MKNQVERLTGRERLLEIPEELQESIGRHPESLSVIAELSKIKGYTVPHSLDVARCNLKIAEHLGLDEEEKDRLVLSGLFHDVGKNGVGREIIEKSGELSEAEREEMDQHARESYRILNEAMPAVAAVVVSHHEFQERIPNGYRNGSNRRGAENGTPPPDDRNGVRRKDDPRAREMSEILALVDQFHSLIDPNRPYRKPASIEEAEEIKSRDPHFSPKAKELLGEIAEHYRQSGKYKTAG